MNAKMNEHKHIADLLPLYVSGALDGDQRTAVAAHLAGCSACQTDLALWASVSEEIIADDQAAAAPRGLADRALSRARQSPAKATGGKAAAISAAIRRIIHLLRSQMPLVQREIWPASAAVIGLGYIAAIIAARSGFVYALAPLIAATCVALIYGPENDPAYELVLSTPTSPRQILLARLVLVFGYNLVLVWVATLGLLPMVHQPLGVDLVLAWLAPMTFLSAAALVLSLWIGAPNAISITYIVWLAQLFAGPLRSPQAGLNLSPVVSNIVAGFTHFWQAPGLLLALSAGLLAAAIWLAGRKELSLPHPA